MPNTTTPLSIIGRAAFVAFPEFGLELIPAKIDSGAYRSAIHAKNIQVIERDGKKILTFDILLGHKSANNTAHAETDTFRNVEIENSFGHSERRYEVKLLVEVDGRRFRTSFTLADRSKKKYPILVGRRLLNGRFLINTDISNIDRVKLQQQYNISLPRDEEEHKS
jgi:hypothetical protein